MQPEKVKNKGQARLFKNPVLESLTKTRPWVIYILYIPVCLYMLYYSHTSLGFSIGQVFKVFFMALAIWSLFEYIAHRYLFHFETDSKWGQRIVYIFHGNHHEYPRDRMRLFMPPVPSIILASVIFTAIWFLSKLIMGNPHYTFMFFPGFMIGYLAYVSMHYAIHAYKPPRYLKALWRNHHLHHYKYPEKGFGVSSTFWDVIFKTVPEKNK
ncbi:sterol desaturase family protein [Pseudopedobacter beijingensis]|uniref:Sterol desaturase family protein n=1 Tax=Pseudopedobacter beijingensis TaxID=1207056 RepID=A0ABW4IGQ8_9SPHI